MIKALARMKSEDEMPKAKELDTRMRRGRLSSSVITGASRTRTISLTENGL
jgi:hypothetical protein